MTLRRVTSAAELAARRDRILGDAEQRLEAAAGRALRQFLRRIVTRLTPATLSALTAAAVDAPRTVHLFTLGEAAGWWSAAVDEHVAAAVRATWRTGFSDASTLPVPGPASAGQADYLAAVKDRLSRTATPTIPDQAFDLARVALADELAHGRGIREASRRLAAEFGWDQPAEFWRGRLADLDAQVDAILDGIGPLGNPAREAARLSDPAVRALQAQRADAVLRIDRVQSTWQIRAERIGRTESTGAYNSGALEAGLVEEAGVKRWTATPGPRTRDAHLHADGQCVGIREPFSVGGTSMMAPGDPTAPADLTVNCRCTLVFARDCDEAAEEFSAVDRVIGEERERRAADAVDAGKPTV